MLFVDMVKSQSPLKVGWFQKVCADTPNIILPTNEKRHLPLHYNEDIRNSLSLFQCDNNSQLFCRPALPIGFK